MSTDVREHAVAVQLVAASAVPRAAFANARAALESSVDAAFLVRDEAQYAFRGAQARVAELFESEAVEAPIAANHSRHRRTNLIVLGVLWFALASLTAVTDSVAVAVVFGTIVISYTVHRYCTAVLYQFTVLIGASSADVLLRLDRIDRNLAAIQDT